jgi:8-oxo-dGTP pyrophosphatase MutT (NUDIX family)
VINFIVDHVQFNFRAAAVIVDDGYVLLHRADYEAFWSLPGGRVEAGEPSATTIARELAEELGPTCDAQVGRLLWVIENFFSHEGARFHELGMYYHVTLGAANPYRAKDRAFNGIEDDLPLHEGEPIRLIFQWFPLETLADMPLYPITLRTRLLTLPTTTELLVESEMDTPPVSGGTSATDLR